MSRNNQNIIPILNEDLYIPGTSTVYWIHDEKTLSVYNSGYVGITSLDPQVRIKAHVKSIKRLKNGKTKYPKVFPLRVLEGIESLKVQLLASNLTEEQSQYLEFLLRPKYSMGWNMSIGGGTRENNELFKNKFNSEYENFLRIEQSLPTELGIDEKLRYVREMSQKIKINDDFFSKELAIYLSDKMIHNKSI